MTRQETALVPRCAGRVPAVRVSTVRDDGRHRDAREVALLEGQLGALAQDIRCARSVASAPAAGGAPQIAGGRRPAHGPVLRGERLRLPGGREVVIRPIEPADAPQLRAGFERLTAVARYKRFLGSVDHLSERQLRYLTTIDHADHEALVALDGTSGDGVGVARYVRDAHDPGQAAVAVVVTDAWQRRGVASALLERLAASARASGIERLTGSSIVGDRAARALAVRAGATIATGGRPGTTALTVRLADATAPAAAEREGVDRRWSESPAASGADGADDEAPRRRRGARARGRGKPRLRTAGLAAE